MVYTYGFNGRDSYSFVVHVIILIHVSIDLGLKLKKSAHHEVCGEKDLHFIHITICV